MPSGRTETADQLSPPEFSVILVSDYAAGDQKSWENLRGTLQALARQTYPGPVEYLLIEHAPTALELPEDLRDILPALRTIPSPECGSYELKNHGAREARAPIIVILDADCRPNPDWLAQIAAAWRAHPSAAVISGRTTYEGRGSLERLSALLSRAYVDRGTAGPTRYVANNNSSWRRSVYLAHPLPHDLGPFAGRIQSEAVIRDAGELLFMPEIGVVHEFEGWPMEADIRKNAGYGTVITRLKDRTLPYAGLVRLGMLSVPLFVAGKTLDMWSDVLRCWRFFGLSFFEMPLAMALAPVVVAMEVPGMLAAFGNRSLGPTEYR